MHKDNFNMDKETKDIVRLIAGIQVDALSNLKQEVIDENPFPDKEMLFKLLNIQDGDILDALNNRINIYTEMVETPQLIGILDEYQLYICSHILFKMEDEWINDNSQGVINTWSLLRKYTSKFHPELTLLKF